jgi:hypothetical protein
MDSGLFGILQLLIHEEPGDFQLFAVLASPSIPLQNYLAKLTVGFRIEPATPVFWPN